LGLRLGQRCLFPVALPLSCSRSSAPRPYFLHGGPLIHVALDQPAGDFEGDVNLGQLDVPEIRIRLSGFARKLRNARAAAIPNPASTMMMTAFRDIFLFDYCRKRPQRSGGLSQVDARLGVMKQRGGLIVASAG